MIALSALAEWLGVHFSGDPAIPAGVLQVVKCADYILTPVAAGAIAGQLARDSIWNRLIRIILSLNTAFQLISVFTGWMITIDPGNHYSHGPLYPAYAVMYFMLIGLTVAELVTYGQGFRRENKVSLYATLLLIITGIFMQEFLGMEIRTAQVG